MHFVEQHLKVILHKKSGCKENSYLVFTTVPIIVLDKPQWLLEGFL